MNHFLREDFDREEIVGFPRLERYFLLMLVHGHRLGKKYDGIDLNVSGDAFDRHPHVMALKNLEQRGYIRIIQDEGMQLCGTAGIELDRKGITLAMYGFDLLELFQ